MKKYILIKKLNVIFYGQALVKLNMYPSFEIENSFNNKVVAGIDEAGRGPLCGPVFASCVIVNKKYYPKQNKIFFGIGTASVEEIESINIRNATKLAMKRSYENLLSKYLISVDCVIVDGNFTPEIDKPAQYVIKGDQKSISIATASIIAKVSRDNLLKIMDKEYPQYNWKNNKGYGTKEHLEAIKKFGLCKYHRKSFIHI